MKIDSIRKYALSLEAVTEEPHHNYSSFRVRGEIFVTIPPEEDFIHVFVGEEDREQALALYPGFLEKLLWGASRAKSTRGRMSTTDLTELDALLNEGDSRWDSFYADRARPCPFFAGAPDESLAQWLEEGLIPSGRALDLGCGNARNAILLAQHGFKVEGIDYSQRALDWAAERVAQAGVSVALSRANVFDIALVPDSFDLVYDSGCFHHIAPHRRQQYMELVVNALKPGGWFGLTCFRPEGGSGLSDEEVYQQRTLGGGLGYTEARLTEIWSQGFEVRVIRQMQKQPAGGRCFGEDFLSVLLARKV